MPFLSEEHGDEVVLNDRYESQVVNAQEFAFFKSV